MFCEVTQKSAKASAVAFKIYPKFTPACNIEYEPIFFIDDFLAFSLDNLRNVISDSTTLLDEIKFQELSHFASPLAFAEVPRSRGSSN